MAESERDGAQASGRRLLNATAIMAAGTLVSKILGFAKAALIVAVLGAANPQTETYTYATLVPNTLYMLVAGGALNTVLVPQIVRHLKGDDDGGEAFVNRVVTAFLALLAVVTLVAMVFVPQVMSLWTSPTWRTPALEPHWTMLVLMATLTMPQLFFYGAFFLIGQVLNARDRFGPMMWAPIVNNVIGIAVLGAYLLTWGTNASHGQPFTTQQVLLLGLGSTVGIVAQTAVLIPWMRAIGFRYRPRWDLKGSGLSEIFHVGKWMVGYVVLTTLAQIVVSNLASNATVAVKDVPGAGMTAYQNAYLLWILPHSLITVSLATAMLPSASRLAAAHDFAGVGAETTRTMRLANTFLLPASLAFVILGFPITHLLFGYGRGADSWFYIALTLVAFGVGLVPYTIQYVYLRAYYALEDTRTVFWLQVAISGANVVFAIALTAVDADPVTIAPRLAIAYSLSYLLGAWITWRALTKRLPGLSGTDLLKHLGTLLVAVAPGAVLAAGISWWFSQYESKLTDGVGVLVAGVVMGVSYLLFAKRLGLTEPMQMISALRRRGQVEEPAPPGEGHEIPVVDATVAQGDDLSVEGPEVPPLLYYPDPDADHPRTLEVPPGREAVSPLQAGDLVKQKYRLDEVLQRRGSTVTWLGTDVSLARAVLVHVLSPHDTQTLKILELAQKAASVDDSRFLRIWDVNLIEEDNLGAYIACEYVPGQSLELALRQGVFPWQEAAWVIREMASGLVPQHAEKRYHRRLNPDTVVITASGNVKIVGFLVEAALHTEVGDDDGEAADVRALGELLYACLVGRWPGGAEYGLPAAPKDASGRVLRPRQVSARVPDALDSVVDRILNPVPQGRASRLTTAQGVVTALSQVLGGVDASRDLDRRLNFPVSKVRLTAPRASGADLLTSPLATAAASGLSASVPVSAGSPAPRRAAEPEDDDATQASGPYLDDDQDWGDHDEADPDADPHQAGGTAASLFDDTATLYTPIPPPVAAPVATASEVELTEPAPAPEPSRGWFAVLIGLFGLVLAVSLGNVFLGQYTQSRAPVPSPAAPHAIVAAKDFDPRADGGDDRENPTQTGLAIDADPATAWTTERYGRSADLNGRKPGVGLILDLGEQRSVGWVRVNLGEGVTVADVRVPTDAAATAAPMTGRASWRSAQTLPATTGEVQVKLDTPVTTRFVMIYLTRLPERGGAYQGSVSGVSIHP